MGAFLLLAVLSATPSSQPSIIWERNELGETAIVPMRSAPFPHPSRDEGFKGRDKFYPRDPHYVDNSVALFIPGPMRGSHPAESAGEAPAAHAPGLRVNVLVYLHGHMNNIRKAMTDYKLREQIVAGGQNVVLVCPEGPKDAADSGCGKLEDADGLKNLVDESLQALESSGKIVAPRLGHVLLAGHSGAYRGISKCLEHGGLDKELTDVCLLDSSYANLDLFIDWIARHPDGRFFSIFTDHLAPENVYLMTHVRRLNRVYTLAAEQDAGDDLVAKTGVLFLHAEKLKHDETVRWLERWLRTRELEK